MKKLKAFTLIELLVAMAVSGIVIAAGYVSYGMISRNYIDFRSHSNEMSQVVTLQGLLSHDFNIAKTIRRYSADEIEIARVGDETVKYQWNENYILRKKSIESDTFFMQIKKAEMHFCGHDQINSGGVIDGLMLTSMIKGQEFIFYFDKQYGSDILVQNENISDGRH